jgi:hypothetical protein
MQENKIIKIGSMILISVTILSLSRSQIYAQNEFVVQKTSSFIDENKIMHVCGELRNLSQNAFTNVIVKGSFYNSDAKLLNEFQRSVELRTINPGEYSPFEILYIDSKTVDQIKSFKVSVQGGTNVTRANPKPVTLLVQPSNARLDIFGIYYINGKVVNNGMQTATNTFITAALYDKNGSLIAIGRGLAEPLNITSHSNAAFGLVVTERSQTFKTKNYSLIAESDKSISLPVLSSNNR